MTTCSGGGWKNNWWRRVPGKSIKQREMEEATEKARNCHILLMTVE
jgi:hypothetical protein